MLGGLVDVSDDVRYAMIFELSRRMTSCGDASLEMAFTCMFVFLNELFRKVMKMLMCQDRAFEKVKIKVLEYCKKIFNRWEEEVGLNHYK